MADLKVVPKADYLAARTADSTAVARVERLVEMTAATMAAWKVDLTVVPLADDLVVRRDRHWAG